MAIKFLCPFGHRLKVPDEAAGKKGRCPVCGQRVYIPIIEPPTPIAPGSGPEPLADVSSAPQVETPPEPPPVALPPLASPGPPASVFDTDLTEALGLSAPS